MKQYVRHIATWFFQILKKLTGFVPSERVFRHLHFSGPFEITFPNGRTLNMFSWGNRVENELAWRGWDGHEQEERQRWAKIVRYGGDILDIGANTATFAITAKALAPDSRVIAFEPVKRIAEKARHNVKVAGVDVEVVCAALGRKKGELPIYDPGGENAYSASLDPNFLDGEKESYAVPVESLDEYCTTNKLDPVAIKLDVEGYEGEVICGAKELLGRGKCVFLCEWLGESESHDEAIRLLDSNQYAALDMSDLSELDLSRDREFTDRNIMLVHRPSMRQLIEQLQS